MSPSKGVVGRSKSGVAGLDVAGDQNVEGEDGSEVEQAKEESLSEAIEDWSNNKMR